MNLNVEKIVERCCSLLPAGVKARPWLILNHGYDILDSEEKLNAYIASYGEMHINKCRKALQNFPFDDFCRRNQQGEITHVDNIEIFDWGCGQGIGTLTLLQYLSDRNMLHAVRRINLIEPSEYAIHRAQNWVKQSVDAHTEIRAFNRLIPDNSGSSWDDIDCLTSKAIHIFSNILDIREVGLRWLAKTASELSASAYCVCVGPQYARGVSRITDFYRLMGAPACFADFAAYPFAYTYRTRHPYGIEVKGFKFTNSSGINDSYSEQSQQRHIDEYDTDNGQMAGLLPSAVVKAYQTLQDRASNAFEIYLRPNVGIERPDFILINISRGVVIVNICDDIADFDKAYDKVEAIKQALFDTYVKSLKIGTVLNRSVYNSIKTALFFTSASPQQVESACAAYYQCLIKERSAPPKDPTKFLLKLYKDNIETLSSVRADGFRFDYYQEIKDLILPQWHPSTAGDPRIRLTKKQRLLFNYESKRLRVRGVAGCGKTQLIAFRSIKENLRTGSKVLIITYNIALIKYIRMRITEVPADFSHGDFEIINYHRFFWSKARRYHGRHIPLSASDKPSFFEPYRDEIIKNHDQYQTIIVDEAQDYMTAWFDCLREYFLTPDGTMILFGDGEQNIFKREQEPGMKMPRVNGFGGSDNPWREMSERISMRMLNPEIVHLASSFAHTFQLSSQPINTSPELNLYDYKMGYLNTAPDVTPKNLAEIIMRIMSQYSIDKKDTVVLSQNISILRETDKCYRSQYNQSTICTFESAEEYENVKKNSKSSEAFLLDLKAIRRVAKVHFTTQSPNLKFATIASFKGWESKTIILLLQNTFSSSQQAKEDTEQSDNNAVDDASLIYTAITRAKENLFIINVGNTTYHPFFQGHIKNDA